METQNGYPWYHPFIGRFHEDASQYTNTCCKCGKEFSGDRIRYVCRKCEEKPEKINY